MSQATKDAKIVAAALRALERKQLVYAFDAYRPETRANPKQEEVLRDFQRIQYRYVVAGNQCMPEGTLISTPSGLKEIQDIRPGDTVYDQNGKEILVEANFDNGEAEVVELISRGIVWGESTLNHTWLTCNSSDRRYKEKELTLEEFKRDTQVLRKEVKLPLGEIDEPHAYVLGALLGDGCSRANGIVISSENDLIPTHIASLLGKDLTAPKSGYSWRIKGSPEINHYNEWCKGKYAHEKTCDLNIIKTWNRDSLLKYVAGLIDTDGSVYVDSWDNLTIRIEMQALSVIESVKYAMLALWQTPVSISINDREKYVNGPTYSIKVSSNAFSKRMVKELSKYILTERKQYKASYDNLSSSRSSSDRIGIKLGQKRKARVYDIRVASSRSLYLTATGLVTHNSGKSQLAAREIAWLVGRCHPYKDIDAIQQGEPLLILVAGQDLTMMATELWAKKIAPFLDLSDWKPEKQGNTLKKVVNTKTGDTIVFLSHSDSSDKNRKHMQGYVANYVWLDEMPSNTAILEELQLRIQSKGKMGRVSSFMATFTPKFRSDKIRKIVDSSREPYSKKYKMSKFDNPIFADSYEEEMARLEGFSESEKNTILYGDWSTGENAVYKFDYDKMTVDSLPNHYNAGWRHIESVDPALRSKCGYTLWAEDPNDGTWYLVSDEYIHGDQALDPDGLFHEIQKRSTGYNLARRISDSMAWYTSVANKYGVNYLIPFNKNSRKEELIKGLQVALSSGKVKIGRWCGTFIDEIQSCQFHEDSDRIINSSSYHTLDCAQYFCDLIPPYDPAKAVLPWDVMLQQSHQRRLQAESNQQKLNNKVSKGRNGRVMRSIKGWGRGKFRIK